MTKSTEAYIFAAQEQALTTNSMRSRIYREVGEDGEIVSGLCRVCGEKTETVAHIAGGVQSVDGGTRDSEARQGGIACPLGVVQKV